MRNCISHLISAHLNLTSCVWLVATILDSALDSWIPNTAENKDDVSCWDTWEIRKLHPERCALSTLSVGWSPEWRLSFWGNTCQRGKVYKLTFCCPTYSISGNFMTLQQVLPHTRISLVLSASLLNMMRQPQKSCPAKKDEYKQEDVNWNQIVQRTQEKNFSKLKTQRFRLKRFTESPGKKWKRSCLPTGVPTSVHQRPGLAL